MARLYGPGLSRRVPQATSRPVTYRGIHQFAPELLGTEPLIDVLEEPRAILRRASVERPLPDVEYQMDPIGWARDILGIDPLDLYWSHRPEYAGHTWDGTIDPLAVICEAIAKGEHVGVESGTGTGKTFLAGWLSLWFLVCFPNSIVVTTAPKAEQLDLHLWKELGALIARARKAYPALTKVERRVRLRATADGSPIADDTDWSKERWAIVGYGCGVDAETAAIGGAASRAKGFHAEHLFVITEETQGIPSPIMEAFRNTLTADHNLHLALGNPLWQGDELHQFCSRSRVRHVIASALDHPNVVSGQSLIPGAVSLTSVRERYEDYKDTPAVYNAQVRGLSPAQAANALIQRAWLDNAAARYDDPAYRTGKPAIGVDVAQSENGDKAAIARGRGACLLSVETFQCSNATDLGTSVWRESQCLDPVATPTDLGIVDPAHIGVDAIGVGAATANELNREAGKRLERITSIVSSASPVARTQRAVDGSAYNWLPDSNQFNNLRSQMYWQLREDLRLGRIALPHDEPLFKQLVTPTFRDDDLTIVESKRDIKKRLGQKSPDKADAVVYWNWVRPRLALPKPPDTRDLTQERRDPTIFLKQPVAERHTYESSTFQQFGEGY